MLNIGGSMMDYKYFGDVLLYKYETNNLEKNKKL